jgi:AraC-like DNA-binding protein
MSPPTQDHQQVTILSQSDAGYEITGALQDLQQARDHAQSCERLMRQSLLHGAIYAGLSRSALARISGYSRRHVGRLLREASSSI